MLFFGVCFFLYFIKFSLCLLVKIMVLPTLDKWTLVRTSSQSDIIIFIVMCASYKCHWNINLSLQILNRYAKIGVNCQLHDKFTSGLKFAESMHIFFIRNLTQLTKFANDNVQVLSMTPNNCILRKYLKYLKNTFSKLP